ncbi:MAG: biopolymer transporter ExbD [Pseudomonadota bacterium]
MAFKRREEEEDVDVNMTPLLDIVFIMLIFFIVTSTFVKEPGQDVIRPPAVTSTDQKPAILVAITADNEIWINKEEVEVDSVRFAAERLRAENPKGGAVIQADADSDAQYLVDVLDQLQAAGVRQIAVATEED